MNIINQNFGQNPGQVQILHGSSSQAWFLPCDGTTRLSTSYPALATIIGSANGIYNTGSTTIGASRAWADIATSIGGITVAVSWNSDFASVSTDWINFTEYALPPTSGSFWGQVVFGWTKFVAFSKLSWTAAYSTDWTSWTVISIPTVWAIVSASFDWTYFVWVPTSWTSYVYSSNWTSFSWNSLWYSFSWPKISWNGWYTVMLLNANTSAWTVITVLNGTSLVNVSSYTWYTPTIIVNQYSNVYIYSSTNVYQQSWLIFNIVWATPWTIIDIIYDSSVFYALTSTWFYRSSSATSLWTATTISMTKIAPYWTYVSLVSLTAWVYLQYTTVITLPTLANPVSGYNYRIHI